MVRLGKKVALMRNMTDTMYNPEKAPTVSHFAGTELVVEHVEKYWCPSFTSKDTTGCPVVRCAHPERQPRSPAAGGGGG
jgi:hypothetical protein